MLKVPCEVYSRIVGYLRPVQSWHKAKQLEFKDRVTFDMSFAKALAEGKVAEIVQEEEKDVSV